MKPNTHSDLTIIFLTLNELPEGWNKFQQQKLLEAVGDTPIISVSKLPTIIGDNCINILQTEPRSSSNVYWQILKACKIATTTFIAIAETDSLYPAEHFCFRPQMDECAYNGHHWSIFSWGVPTYGYRNRKGNYTMICSRELVIKSLEERFAKYPEGTPEDKTGEIGRERIEKHLGLTPVKTIEFYSKDAAVVNLNHVYGLDDRQRRKHKTLGTLLAFDIPRWGPASDLIKNFK
jgi:hypothetical protein